MCEKVWAYRSSRFGLFLIFVKAPKAFRRFFEVRWAPATEMFSYILATCSEAIAQICESEVDIGFQMIG